VIAASLDDLQAIDRITPAAATAIRHPPVAQARQLAARALGKGHATLVPADADYPATLRSIPDPPVVLFTVGQRAVLQPPAVAIVGSRQHSRYGAEIARQLGRAAAEAGIPVVSGMAKGLDAIAQTAALDAGGTSIGVLGTGADIVYPPENAPLFQRVEESGLLLTEHPPGDHGFRGAFPRRNRLISGLARALVVVEAAEASGTLLTVTSALEQGREVLVVPGPINSVTSKGTNRLLRDGATPLLVMDDMLAAFGAVSQPGTASPRMPPRCDLSPEEARTLAVLSADGRDLDDVALAAGLPIGLVLGTLLGLELGGLVEQLPGNVYRRR
jgi:DNA processing protein